MTRSPKTTALLVSRLPPDLVGIVMAYFSATSARCSAIARAGEHEACIDLLAERSNHGSLLADAAYGGYIEIVSRVLDVQICTEPGVIMMTHSLGHRDVAMLLIDRSRRFLNQAYTYARGDLESIKEWREYEHSQRETNYCFTAACIGQNIEAMRYMADGRAIECACGRPLAAHLGEP